MPSTKRPRSKPPKKPSGYQKLYQVKTITYAKNGGEKWTTKDRQFLEKNAGKLSAHQITRKLRRTYLSVQNMAYELDVGLRIGKDKRISVIAQNKKSLFVIRRPSWYAPSTLQTLELSKTQPLSTVIPLHEGKMLKLRNIFEKQFSAWRKKDPQEAEKLLCALQAWANAVSEFEEDTLWVLMIKQFERLALSKHTHQEKSILLKNRESKLQFIDSTGVVLWLFQTSTAKTWMKRFRSE